jgi:hypothetical protein
LGQFVSKFPGLTGTPRISRVCSSIPNVARLADFAEREDLVSTLLSAMIKETASRPPNPDKLGLIGKKHFQQRFDEWFKIKRDGDGKLRFWYGKACLEVKGIPYVFEVAVAQTARPGQLFHGINFSPTFADPFAATHLPAKDIYGYGVGGVLSNAHAREDHDFSSLPFHSAVAVHLVSPAPQFLDKGKTRLEVPKELARAVGKALWDTTKFFYREGERRARDFEQVLLTEYIHKHPEIAPRIYSEPRGTLYEPHTGREVPLGTREVESYTFPSWRYNKILFVEKKGLWPVLKDAQLAERYDMAVIAGEGYASEACRMLFQSAHQGEYQLFVLHDADPWGYNIARTLREETSRMPGYKVVVEDLGLTLEHALDMRLQTEEFTRTKAIPQALELTKLEREYFVGRQATSKSWICRRVELNALTCPELIAYIERRLGECHAIGEVEDGEGHANQKSYLFWPLDDEKAQAQAAESGIVRNRQKVDSADGSYWKEGA